MLRLPFRNGKALNMRKIIVAVGIIMSFMIELEAQEKGEVIKGHVLESGEGSKPVVGANVYWLGTTSGTTTGLNGKFTLEKPSEVDQLVVSFVGFTPDTISVEDQQHVYVSLKKNVNIDEVEVEYRSKSTEASLINPINSRTISEGELTKAACCNLSESFETNPSVDVSFTDAVTGTRQIEMLGLAGQYSQITRENMPYIRGLATTQGLTYIPGPWIESIQLNKGSGSVVNGYESITGQINTELRKPEDADKFYLNGFANEMGRLEGNAHFTQQINDNIWSMVMVHAKSNNIEHDNNNDGFLDHPLENTYIGLNRWRYIGDKGLRSQFGVKALYKDQLAGQAGYDTDAGSDQPYWGMEQTTKRYETWGKIGYINPNKPYQSIGSQFSGILHDQDAVFGLRPYEAEQQSFYANVIYQDIISTSNHVYRVGASFQYDKYNETFDTINMDRTETVPGVFAEYTLSLPDYFDMVLGLRGDHHNMYGFMLNPRLHLRYGITDKTVIRLSAGRGVKTPQVLIENIGLMASNRAFVFETDEVGENYGLKPEIAWNIGGNFTQKFTLDYRQGSFIIDLYHTRFENQVVVDLEQDAREVVFYNLEGESYSTSLQFQLDYELFNRFDVRLAHRWYDVMSTYAGELKQKPLLASNRAFVNLAYETRNYWKFDYTLNWQGQKRLPNTSDSPVEYQLNGYSPSFFLMNAQVSKTFWNRFEWYVGAENLLNYTQDNPVLASGNPLDNEYFDSSMIWGPVFGRKIYTGFRYRLK